MPHRELNMLRIYNFLSGQYVDHAHLHVLCLDSSLLINITWNSANTVLDIYIELNLTPEIKIIGKQMEDSRRKDE